jgi:hypothetical protein
MKRVGGLWATVVSLRRELESGEYRTGPYREFLVHDAKPRLISAAPFRDRWCITP